MSKKIGYWLEKSFMIMTLGCIVLLLIVQIFSNHPEVPVMNTQEVNSSEKKEITFELQGQESNKLIVLVNGDSAGNFITGKCKVAVSNGDVVEIMGLEEKYTVKVIQKNSMIQNSIEDKVYEIENEIKYIGKIIITN